MADTTIEHILPPIADLIAPQPRRLRLSPSMPFAELDDPRGIAKNVAGVGRWGNGEA